MVHVYNLCFFIDKLINDAKSTNSVNTIFLDETNTLVGENTDVYGLQAAYLKGIDNSSNKKVLVIGAGGVSPSVILSIQKTGIRNVSITNRTNEKCIFLKKKFNFLSIIPWVEFKSEIKNFDIIINATSLGLKNGDDFQIKFNNVKSDLIYIDTIYNPLETKTIKYLKENDISSQENNVRFVLHKTCSFVIGPIHVVGKFKKFPAIQGH